jgi:hypothetical protein
LLPAGPTDLPSLRSGGGLRPPTPPDTRAHRPRGSFQGRRGSRPPPGPASTTQPRKRTTRHPLSPAGPPLVCRRSAPVGGSAHPHPLTHGLAVRGHAPWPSRVQTPTRVGVYHPTAQAHHPASVVTRRAPTDLLALRSGGGLRPPTPPGTRARRPRSRVRAAAGRTPTGSASTTQPRRRTTRCPPPPAWFLLVCCRFASVGVRPPTFPGTWSRRVRGRRRSMRLSVSRGGHTQPAHRSANRWLQDRSVASIH